MINPKTKQRELAYVAKIDRIEPIEGSDNCESAVVGGWHIMTKKNTFKAGDLAVYFEIDSKVPEIPLYDFLIHKHYKIKTQKYTFGGKGNFISQGLLMSFSDFGWEANKYEEGTPLTEELGVTYAIADDNKRKSNIDKYSKMRQRRADLFKKSKLVRWLYKRTWGKKLLFIFIGRKSDNKASFWPYWVVKTDEERVQNLPNLFPPDNTEWFVTEKIDGTSTTFTYKHNKIKKDEFYVCSRNVCFDRPEKINNRCYYDENVYMEMADKYNMDYILEVLFTTFKEDYCEDIDFVTIQGETYGAGVQKKTYGLSGHDLKVFNLIIGNTKTGYKKRFNPREMTDILTVYGLPCVPILEEHFILPNSIEEMVSYADGMSVVDPGSIREGVVLRTADGVNSFKAVSNKYLIEKGE